MQQIKEKKAFTLIEIIVVIIVIGVLAGLALPRLGVAVEKIRSGEGANVLTVLYSAQKRFEAENAAYQTGTATTSQYGVAGTDYLADGDLDVKISPPANFDTPHVMPPSDTNCTPPGASTDPVASVDRSPNGGTTFYYTMQVDVCGKIHCVNRIGYTYCGHFGYLP